MHVMKTQVPSPGAVRDTPTLVFVSRRHCGASRRMESLIAWIKVTKKRHLRVVDLDADRSPELTDHLGVSETPTLLVLTGGSEVGRLEGRSTGRQIEALIRPHLREERAMAANDDELDVEDVGSEASDGSDVADAPPDQVQPEEREPASDEEAAQDDYANTDDRAS